MLLILSVILKNCFFSLLSEILRVVFGFFMWGEVVVLWVGMVSVIFIVKIILGYRWSISFVFWLGLRLGVLGVFGDGVSVSVIVNKEGWSWVG